MYKFIFVALISLLVGYKSNDLINKKNNVAIKYLDNDQSIKIKQLENKIKKLKNNLDQQHQEITTKKKYFFIKKPC